MHVMSYDSVFAVSSCGKLYIIYLKRSRTIDASVPSISNVYEPQTETCPRLSLVAADDTWKVTNSKTLVEVVMVVMIESQCLWICRVDFRGSLLIFYLRGLTL